jgi:hypothetical protein
VETPELTALLAEESLLAIETLGAGALVELAAGAPAAGAAVFGAAMAPAGQGGRPYDFPQFLPTTGAGGFAPAGAPGAAALVGSAPFAAAASALAFFFAEAARTFANFILFAAFFSSGVSFLVVLVFAPAGAGAGGFAAAFADAGGFAPAGAGAGGFAPAGAAAFVAFAAGAGVAFNVDLLNDLILVERFLPGAGAGAALAGFLFVEEGTLGAFGAAPAGAATAGGPP